MAKYDEVRTGLTKIAHRIGGARNRARTHKQGIDDERAVLVGLAAENEDIIAQIEEWRSGSPTSVQQDLIDEWDIMFPDGNALRLELVAAFADLQAYTEF